MTVKNLNGRALGVGVALYLGLYVAHLLLLPVLMSPGADGKPDTGLYGLGQLLGLATCLLSGFFAGRIAGTQGFVHGLIVGAVGTVITALAALGWGAATGAGLPSVVTLPFWMTVNGFLSAVGGFAAVNVEQDENKPAGKASRG
jgi:hypothetical protein